MDTLRHVFERRTLPAQVLLLGALGTAASLLLARLLPQAPPDIAWLLLAGGGATLACAWPAWRAQIGRAHV